MLVGIGPPGGAATLTGTFTPVPTGSNVNLTALGALDWVHWGLYTDTSLNRKAGVTPWITDFTELSPGGSNAFVFVYQYADNYNGYSWSDGVPEVEATDTPTGVWAYGLPNLGTGFEFTVPADTTVRTLKVFVGVFSGRGAFTASLSDGSAPTYTNSQLSNLANGPGAVYTLQYAAASAGQTLRIRWTLLQAAGPSAPQANVTLQAATLSEAGANHPPFAVITAPGDNANFASGSGIGLSARAFDPDGTVSQVEYFDGATLLGQGSGADYSFAWNGATPGRHPLTARVTDNAGGSRTSPPIDVFVHGPGGSLTGATAFAPSSADLTSEGAVDWSHWGLLASNSFNRKYGVLPRLSDFTPLGPQPVRRYTNNYTAYAWSDGDPTASEPGSHTGVFKTGFTNGFEVTVPADTTLRRLKVYVGLYGTRGAFQAWLGDGSAPAYADASLDDVYADRRIVYMLDFRAASAGQLLHVRYRSTAAYDFDYGNVTLQAATLSGGNLPPTVFLTSPADGVGFPSGASLTLTAEAGDSDGSVTKVEFVHGTTKLGEDLAAPYSYPWNSVPDGTYTLTAKATDNSGETRTSRPVRITVGTPPPAAVLLTNVAMTAGGFTFAFFTESNRQYTVEHTADLSPGSWLTLTNLSGRGDLAWITNPPPLAPVRFYRVVAR
jgi:hypothetical protein